jgi:hypothetical protein
MLAYLIDGVDMDTFMSLLNPEAALARSIRLQTAVEMKPPLSSSALKGCS